MADTVIPLNDESGEIDIDTFRVMIEIRAKAFELAQKMPNTNRKSSIYEHAEEIEKWLTRKV